MDTIKILKTDMKSNVRAYNKHVGMMLGWSYKKLLCNVNPTDRDYFERRYNQLKSTK